MTTVAMSIQSERNLGSQQQATRHWGHPLPPAAPIRRYVSWRRDLNSSAVAISRSLSILFRLVAPFIDVLARVLSI